MNLKEALHRLERMGTAQNRKVYARHGVRGEAYGVSYANLGTLRKAIRVDHALAAGLWKSGIHDARILATMVADPGAADRSLLDAWVRDLDNYVITDAFVGFAARTPLARDRMEWWVQDSGEWIGAAGWGILARLAISDKDLPGEYFSEYLDRIAGEIHQAKNRTRHSMNNALIAIGTRNPGLQKQALAVASTIGNVKVDHGETGCKTPDAAAYIRKTVARKKTASRAKQQ